MTRFKLFFSKKEERITKIIVGFIMITVFCLIFGPGVYAQFTRVTGNTGWGYGYGYGYGYSYGNDGGANGYKIDFSVSAADAYGWGNGFGYKAASSGYTPYVGGGSGALPPAPVPVPVVPAPATPSNLILHDPSPAGPLPANVTVGTLVKRSDMSAVYFIDQDNRRHAFPNEATYLSWYPDFSGVQTISSTTLAAIPLGSNVTMRPGTHLVKIQTDPKVYAVEPYGVLRWVTTEQIASALFGPSWSAKVVDINPAFFINYQIGSDISASTHPTGSVIQYIGSTNRYYIDNGLSRLIAPDVFSQDLFQNKFVITNVATTISYPAGAAFPITPIETLMTLR